MGNSIAENAPACKDGRVNARLSELVGAFDRMGYLVQRVETNGEDFELKLRHTEPQGR